MYSICSNIKAAKGDIQAQLVIKNVNIINVFTQTIDQGDIAIHAGQIVGIGSYEGQTQIDGSGMYASAGLMDAHVHIESSMMTPQYFSKALLPHGVTAVIADPHEIANVHGMQGIEFMINDVGNFGATVYYMAPSCVPAISFEKGGAQLKAHDLIKLNKSKRIIGLAEVMDVTAVLSCQQDMIEKLNEFDTSIIDGHAPLLADNELNAYITAGVKTDHECSNVAEALEKVRKGMYVLIREGSAAKNLEQLLPAVTDLNFHRYLFCTDDRHADDLLEEGSIDYVVRNAIKLGMDPVRAITIASYNVAQCYGLRNVGAIAPGYKADLILFNDLNRLDIKYVIKDGKCVDFNNITSLSGISEYSDRIYKKSMNIAPIHAQQLKVRVEGKYINVIEAVSGSLITNHLRCAFEQENGFVTNVKGEDILKIAVFERHKQTGAYFVGYIKGLGIKGCSIAQTISHDSHNIVAIGHNDEDITAAVNTLIASGGGIAIAAGGVVTGCLELPVGGLMKNEPIDSIARQLKQLRKLLKEFCVNDNQDIFVALSFMSLAVIPHIKITSQGLFDYDRFNFISLFEADGL